MASRTIEKLFKENHSIKELHLNGDNERRFGPSLGANLLGLKENDTLEKLNITGNSIGDQGARIISEVLKSNIKLRSLDCDENEIGIEGYYSIHQVFSTGLNTTLHRFTYPTQDLETFNENIDANQRFGTIKRNMMEKEKQKDNLFQIVNEIMKLVKKFENNYSNSLEY
ncbi:hypothetical protein C1645_780647 [Glomus cerebriforme]|uniref:RNI-like protein n=1 Tax=Glomus cerebriforme TaxID=658196 RepID=A0A397SM87_9GLOM|nr:hypothetical protein C1645_780647 [Glomus cerebriforme]